MSEVVKLCVSPYSRKVVAICDRVENSSDPEEATCCMCSSETYMKVDKLESWYSMLMQDGINSKHRVREEIKQLLKEIKK